MEFDLLTLMRIAGVVAVAGALLYALGDVLLLGHKVGALQASSPVPINTDVYPRLRRRIPLLNGLAAIPAQRLAWGGLLGVFAAPLVLVGVWQLYQGLRPAGLWLALPPVLLFGYGVVLGPFVHGSFIYLGELARALAMVEQADQPRLLDMLVRQQRAMMTAYAAIFLCNIAGSIWFAAAVATGETEFPRWVAAINPITMTVAWLAVKRLLPARLRDYTEGAGFNIAYIVFFALTTAAL